MQCGASAVAPSRNFTSREWGNGMMSKGDAVDKAFVSEHMLAQYILVRALGPGREV